MALVAPVEGLEDALGKGQGLKRLVKGERKRVRTPDVPTKGRDGARAAR